MKPVWGIVVMCALAACEHEDKTPQHLQRRVLEVTRPDGSRSVLDVEVADTDATRSKGLMFRQHMDENQGMVFVWPEEVRNVFWMKNTYIPLDMLFVAKGKVVAVIPYARPRDETPLDPGVDSDMVLEVNAGWVARTETLPGSRVTLQNP